VLEFKPKLNSARIDDQIINDLIEFIFVNKDFQGFTLTFLGDWKKTINNKNELGSKIEQSFRYDDIKNSSKKDEFIITLGDFYDTTEKSLEHRRGQALEEIWNRIGPWNSEVNGAQPIFEAMVWHDNVKLSESDIDFAYQNNKAIEIDECKASAKNTVLHGISERTKSKYTLMVNTKNLGTQEGINTEAYIITLDSSTQPTKSLLRRHGFNDSLKILCRKDLKDKLV